MLFVIIMILSLLSGIASGSIGGLFVSVPFGLFVGIILQMCFADAKNTVDNSDKIKQTNKKVKKQDKYDNDWGIIEYKDK